MTFRIGQKVVKFRNAGGMGRPAMRGETLPVVGGVYTIRGFDNDGFNGPSIWLEEIVNHPHMYKWSDGLSRFQECSWLAEYFRPVKETDISIFTAMLAPTPKQKVRA